MENFSLGFLVGIIALVFIRSWWLRRRFKRIFNGSHKDLNGEAITRTLFSLESDMRTREKEWDTAEEQRKIIEKETPFLCPNEFQKNLDDICLSAQEKFFEALRLVCRFHNIRWIRRFLRCYSTSQSIASRIPNLVSLRKKRFEGEKLKLREVS